MPLRQAHGSDRIDENTRSAFIWTTGSDSVLLATGLVSSMGHSTRRLGTIETQGASQSSDSEDDS